VAVTVTKATTTTTLALSKDTITYGHETAERLSVAVTPRFADTPAAKVSVKAGKTTICVIILNKADKGSCTLAARQLKSGSYPLVAAYSGSADYDPSASAKRTLTVAK
jgi:hypothetical protein